MKKSSSVLILITALLFGAGGYILGMLQSSTQSAPTLTKSTPTFSVIEMQKREDDQLMVKISGNARIVWGERSNVAEGDGLHAIPLGQIPSQNDLALTEYPYLGNAKTMKYYPSDSYPARGTEVQYRRFFATQEEAEAAGFIPMKNME